MSNLNKISRSQAIEIIAAQLHGPIELNKFVEKVLQIWHSNAKNPQAGVRQAIRDDYEGKTLLFLNDHTLVSPISILPGVHIRIPLSQTELEAGCIKQNPAFFCLHPDENWYQPLPVDAYKFVKADGRFLPVRFTEIEEEIEGLNGPEIVKRKAFDLTNWRPIYEAKLGDAIIVTILDWKNGRYQLDLEPALQRQQQEAAIIQRNQLFADTLYEQLEKARYDSIWAKKAILTALARLPKDEIVPDHWLWILHKDGRMDWYGTDIRYTSNDSYRMVDMMLGLPEEAEEAEISLTDEEAKQVYCFKVHLKYNKGIWRRVEIQGDQTLADLDDMLHVSFNHDWDHLSGFWQLIPRGKGKRYREVDIATIYPFGSDGYGEDLLIAELGLQVGAKLKYVYDFGDWIEHQLELESIKLPDAQAKYPRQIEQNKPRYKYCPHCKEQGKKEVATWICWECSSREQKDVLICEDCLVKLHEDHYAEEVLY